MSLIAERPRELELSLQDHQRAFTEVSFLLDIFAATVGDLTGGQTASIGRVAGRQLARKLPLHLPEPTLAKVLEALHATLARGFSFQATVREGAAELRLGRCVVREVCRERGKQPGGDLCCLFHSFFDGMVNELLARSAKSVIAAGEEECTAELEIR